MKDIEYNPLDREVQYLEDEKDFGILVEVKPDGDVQWTTIEGQVWDDKTSFMSVDDKVDMEVLDGGRTHVGP